jgi:hypothetical protein
MKELVLEPDKIKEGLIPSLLAEHKLPRVGQEPWARFHPWARLHHLSLCLEMNSILSGKQKMNSVAGAILSAYFLQWSTTTISNSSSRGRDL